MFIQKSHSVWWGLLLEQLGVGLQEVSMRVCEFQLYNSIYQINLDGIKGVLKQEAYFHSFQRLHASVVAKISFRKICPTREIEMGQFL